MFSNNAAMAGWLCCILNTLIGSHDAKGGAMYSGGSFLGFDGAYKLATFDGAINQTDQMTLVRNGPYEASSEYKNHIKKGENPYPSKHIFHPMFSGYAANNAAEMMLHDSIKYPPIDNRNDPPQLSKEVLSHAKKKEDHGLRCVQQWRIKNHDQTRRKSEDPAPDTR